MLKLTPRAFQTCEKLTPLQSLILRCWRPQWICKNRRNALSQQRRLVATSTEASRDEKPYFVTTPIFYVNADPHVGHMYTMILTDVLKRWQVLKGRKALLCTGTDEHGMKIQRAAAKAGIEPKLFCDKGAETFKHLAKRVELSNDIFMRTTDLKHREAVEYAWQMLQDRGYIYESKHEGWYSVSDETYYPQTQVQLIVDPPTGRKIMVSIETGTEVEWTSERNYHFRLSAFRERLLEFYATHPAFIVPVSRMKDVVDQVTAGLEDLSISRPADRLTWGVRVPTDSSQTTYVWLDALLNYASATGYPFAPGTESMKGWPPDVHVIGKDIVRFHCIYWPAFLMALELPLPKQVLTHGHWTLGRRKMSKSTGNVVNPFFALDRFGVDVMRWYLIHDGGIGDDADYENSFIVNKYKSLRGGLGNLAARIMRNKAWSVPRAVRAHSNNGTIGTPDELHELHHPTDMEFCKTLAALPAEVDKHMSDLLPNRALQTVMGAVYAANAHISVTAPWHIVKKQATITRDKAMDASASEDANKTFSDAQVDFRIYLNAEALRLVGIMLQPFIPTSAARLLDMLGVRAERRSWNFCQFGADDDYGTPFVDLGKGELGSLFPGLINTR